MISNEQVGELSRYNHLYVQKAFRVLFGSIEMKYRRERKAMFQTKSNPVCPEFANGKASSAHIVRNLTPKAQYCRFKYGDSETHYAGLSVHALSLTFYFFIF